MKNHLLHFGRHQGQSIRWIPVHYVFWLLGQPWFRQKYPALYPFARGRVLKHFEAEIEEEQSQFADLI